MARNVISYNKPISGFYESQDWKELRYEVIKERGAKCACCGKTPQKHGIAIHVDHIKPRSKYPALELDKNNLQILCEDCNLGKSNKDQTNWQSNEMI